MDNVKMPFCKQLPEETLKTQRVEIYLNDLKERLKELRVQHDEVIQNSVDIIKEIDEVSSGLLLPQKGGICSSDNVTKIKRLIQEFETARESNSIKIPISIESKVDIRKILQNFEKLNESHVLKESLVLFKRAKESLEKIDTFLGTHLDNVITQSVNTNKTSTGHTIISANVAVAEHNDINDSRSFKLPNLSSDTIQTLDNSRSKNSTDGSLKLMNDPVTDQPELTATGSRISTNSNSSLKNRIDMFNKNSPETSDCDKTKGIMQSCYASCCSSLTSVDVYQSTENLCEFNRIKNERVNSLEIGYEGDNDDSEYDLFAIKRKKNKISSANQ